MPDDLLSTPWQILDGDSLEWLREMPDDCVHCCVTSPPYYALRDYGVDGQIGLEDTPEEFIAKLVAVFAEVRRVLHPSGTLWCNIGDSYASGGNSGGGAFMDQRGAAAWKAKKSLKGWRSAPAGVKPKDMLGIPWLLAFGLRADGWFLRSEIIWSKKSPMPEAVKDRPTKSHEQIFLLSKSSRYFYDPVASAEAAVSTQMRDGFRGGNGTRYTNGRSFDNHAASVSGNGSIDGNATRNMRSVWTLSTEAFPGAHFATFPTELVRRCLLAGTSEKGCCPECGNPCERVVEKERVPTRPGTTSKVRRDGKAVDRRTAELVDCPNKPWASSGIEVGNRDPQRHCTQTVTTGWQPTCDHGIEPIPCLVLDPFSGAGTTLMVARRMQCRALGIELNPEYAEMARERIRDDMPLFN